QNLPIEGKAAKYVSFSNDLDRRIPEERFRYAGFTLRTIAVDGHHALETDPDERWVSAVLRFRDAIGRQASAAVRAGYRMQGERIVIDWAFIAPLAAPAPRIDFFYVPASRFPDPILRKRTSHAKLWDEVVKRSLRLARPDEWPVGEQDYLVFAFVMDRLAPDARLELRVSSKARGVAGDDGASKILNFDGWFAGISGGRFDLQGAAQPYFKVLYTPGSDVPKKKRKRKTIGLFSNR
ncbi:MAG: hypothetical protein HKP30_02660, partial [Myxococcales bacterium]|nr:hypothetical protein [Myxococcales bacterium]